VRRKIRNEVETMKLRQTSLIALALSIIVVPLCLFYLTEPYFTLSYPVQKDEKGYYLAPNPLASPAWFDNLYGTEKEFALLGSFWRGFSILYSLIALLTLYVEMKRKNES